MADKIEKIRKQIDRTDQVLLTALAERMSVMPDIAIYKKQNDISVFQEEREQAIMKRIKNMSSEQGLNSDFVEEIFLSIFNEAKRIQHETMNKTD